MARVDIGYSKATGKINVFVTHKRSKTVVSTTDSSIEAYEIARFLTKVFHEITIDVTNECHKRAIETIERMQHEPNNLSN